MNNDVQACLVVYVFNSQVTVINLHTVFMFLSLCTYVYSSTNLNSVLAIVGWWLIPPILIPLARGGLQIIPKGSVSVSEYRKSKLVIVQAALFCVPIETRTGPFSYIGHTCHRFVQFS